MRENHSFSFQTLFLSEAGYKRGHVGWSPPFTASLIPCGLFLLFFKTQRTWEPAPGGPSPTHAHLRVALSALSAHLLVRVFHAAAVGPLPAVGGPDGECVVFLLLTVQFLFRSDYSLARGLIHHHGIKGGILPVNFKATDLTWGVNQSGLGRPPEPSAHCPPPPKERDDNSLAARGFGGSVDKAGGAVL